MTDHSTSQPGEVLIDGVRYVPVSNAHITAKAIEDAVVSQYWGDDWRTEYPDALRRAYVIVDEDSDNGHRESAAAFVARILAAAQKAQAGS